MIDVKFIRELQRTMGADAGLKGPCVVSTVEVPRDAFPPSLGSTRMVFALLALELGLREESRHS